MTDTMPLPPATTILGQSLAEFRSHAFESAVWEKATMCLLDALGLAQIARNEATTRAMCDLSTVLDPTTPGSARLWPCARRTSLPEAVAANAVAVHGHFHDDSDSASWAHPGSLITPAAVGIAESRNGDLETVLRSIIAGYSTINWLGDQEHVAHALITRGIRTSPAFGTIGSAAASSVGFGLDAQQAANAVAIGTSITGGLLEPLRCGSDEWRIQNATAARGGVLAAQLAARGVKGAATALEGSRGFLNSLAGIQVRPQGWSRPLQFDAILGIYAKPWATLGDNMAAARAARLMYEKNIDTSRIRSISVKIWHAYTDYPGTSFKGPYTLPVQALASTAFATAAMLIFGDLEYDAALNQRENPAVLDLVRKVSVVPNREGTKLDAELRVTMRDGTEYVEHAANAPRTWLYHDPDTSIAIFERRMGASGFDASACRTMATGLFDPQARKGLIRPLLDQCTAT